ncbi:MAG TPA: HDIG domain-containing protein [Anaerolineales bacterium]|nr:HDIG domain-containing protein [Anaerolineales bacterium]
MADKANSIEFSHPRRRSLFLSLLLVLALGTIYGAQMLPLYTRLSATQPEVGEVAAQDIVAPRALTFSSEILTDRQREAAALAVPSIYTTPDTSVARRQLERLRAALAYITTVRADAFASSIQKVADLSALEDIHFDQETAESILSLSDTRWQAVQQEAIVVLEQVMRTAIREDRLEDARRNLPTLISLAFPEDQAALIAGMVSGFIAPNSFFSEALTEAAREQARQAVTPIMRSFVQGETILQRGQVVSITDQEALVQFGLVHATGRWQDFAAAAALTLLVFIYFFLYLRRNPVLTQDLRGLTVITVLFSLFLIGGRLIVPSQTVIPYIFPLSAFSLIVASLFGTEVAMVLALPLAVLYAYDVPNALDLTLYNLLGSSCGVLALGAARRVTSFFGSALAITVAEIAIILAFRLTQASSDLIAVAILAGVAMLNGIASSSLAVLMQYFLAQFLGMTTALQLMEVSRPDHPLLQFILRQAPGTYQHSLQVANLAEQAAEHVGADTLLTRVGAIYHDAGKALNPFFFIENQLPGSPNPHDNLDPVTSATSIIRHIADGLELAQRYRLPRRIHDFIAEHHGTMITHYQYVRAVEAANGDEDLVDQRQFIYPGPVPSSRETAILMLADGSEARMRAEHPKDEDELRQLIKNVVEDRLSTGQLDNTDLTLRDLDIITESFTATLRGTYHPRLEYPKLETSKAHKIDTSPTVPILSRPAPDVPTNPQADT